MPDSSEKIEQVKKKLWANLQGIMELFTPKNSIKLSKIWVWNPRSGKNLFRIPDPGSRGQKGTGSRIRISNTDYKIVIPAPYLIRYLAKFRKIFVP
jgi:hypothetical protein